jgi:hypothetical protein
MQCEKCLAVTSNKLSKKCPKKGCGGKLVKQKDARSFSVVRAHSTKKEE